MQKRIHATCKAVVVAAAWSSAFTTGVMAQANTVAGVVTAPAVGSCRLVDLSKAAANVSAPLLFAACGSKAVPIGVVAHYKSASNPATGSVVIVALYQGHTRVWLASPLANDGGVQLEELTRELAKLSGKAGKLGLGDAKVDIDQFAETGKLSVASSAGAKSLDLVGNMARAVAVSR